MLLTLDDLKTSFNDRLNGIEFIGSGRRIRDRFVETLYGNLDLTYNNFVLSANKSEFLQKNKAEASKTNEINHLKLKKMV